MAKKNGNGKKGGIAFGIAKKIFKLFFWTGLLVCAAGLAALYGYYKHISSELPKIESLEDYRPPTITTVLSEDGRVVGEFFEERRRVVPLSRMPDMLKKAFVAAEDDRFYEHEGIDFVSIARAFVKNLQAGTIVQGGSTITQQVTKSFFLTPEKSYRRKMKEAILAYRIDNHFSKDEILFLYLNQIYLGHGAYGVEAAAENYFGKKVEELNLAECALLAGLPQAPSRYSPFKRPEMARNRQVYVLKRMVEEGYATDSQTREALDRKLDIRPRKNLYVEEVPYFTEYVRRYVEEKYGRDRLYNDGLQVFAAVNVEMQMAARRAVDEGLRELDKRQGYRGSIERLAEERIEEYSLELARKHAEDPVEKDEIVEGVVIGIDDRNGKVAVRMGEVRGEIPLENMRWAKKPNPKVSYRSRNLRKPGDALKVGDVILVKALERKGEDGEWTLSLEQAPKAQAALLCLEAGTGHVKAMVGGRDFRLSQFNRAIQSRRQPGSAFKPVVYAAALDKGYTPASVIVDTAVVYEDENMVWKPKNYDRKFYGPTLFREALVHSRNLVTIKILRDIGVDYAVDYARKLGIESDLERNLSIALGSSGVSLLELVGAYSVFANQGYRIEPVFVTKILDRDGKVLEEAGVSRKKVIESSTAYLVTNILESVIEEGTGRRVRALGRPAAGKTGTTNDLNDAWFLGYTPGYVSGAWVGFDEEASLGRGESGSRAASPIWLEFMSAILEGKPVRRFQEPKGVEHARIDAKTGLLAASQSEKTYTEVFKEGTAPTRRAPKTQSAPSEYEEFFKNGF